MQQLARAAPGPAVDVEREDLGQVGQVADDEPRETVVPDRRDLAVEHPGDPSVAEP
ncbi:hypothetical protein OV090_21855 [Nannocystis sp. RBIL2]|uniref:hypothetical protein n=1 Tax=Nannocystis sp. RBIL2 TaxID=2996788 RepID=UPI00226D9315|nr:hypothetical protein [Nannocystis sp. RBIL2]MCY1067407.1 hypothetical protein [Nannocystis sp. RBIL2]